VERLVTRGTAALSAVLLAVAAPSADAQTARDLEGTWTVVSAVAEQGGTRTDVLGPDPVGTLVFGADGRYALIFLRRDLPKFVSNNRASGTPDENRAVVQGSIAHFGTYRVDEAGKALIFRIEGSTFPNWTGAEQRRPFALRGDELTYTSPGSIGVATEVTVRRTK
jgi:hypothetical protein